MTQESEQPPILVDRYGSSDQIGRITLNRPQALNALSPELLWLFEQALRDFESDNTVKVVVIRGAGRAFSSGYDLMGGGQQRAAGQSRPVGGERSTYEPLPGRRLIMNTRTNMVRVSDMYLYFWNMAKVTIAQLHGYCLAGGCELAMMADLVIAAEDAMIGHPGVRFSTSRTAANWPLIIGMRRAKELLFTGDTVSGRVAEEIGMINRAVPADQLEAEVERWAERISVNSADLLALNKRSVNAFFEPLIYPGIHAATDTDAMGGSTEQNYMWQDKIREGGMREAISWRDGRYRDAPQIH
jgi:enoyl-CoA hydratase